MVKPYPYRYSSQATVGLEGAVKAGGFTALLWPESVAPDGLLEGGPLQGLSTRPLAGGMSNL